MNDSLLRLLIGASVRGGVMVITAMCLRPIVSRFAGRNAAHGLWIAALVTFLCALPIRTPFSLRNFHFPTKSTTPGAAETSSTEEAPSDVIVRVRALEPKSMKQSNEPSAAIDYPIPAAPVNKAFNWESALAVTWLAGFALAITHVIWRWQRTARMVSKAKPVEDALWEDLLRRFDQSGRVRVAATSQITAPALAGIWHPKILLPRDWRAKFSDAEIEAIALHELGHCARHDLLWEWLFALARCLHWMNPAAWLAEHCARGDRELACDAWALEHCRESTSYGEALIAIVERMRGESSDTFAVAAIASRHRQLRQRILGISTYRPRAAWVRWLAWAPGGLLFALLATDPMAAESNRPAPATPETPVTNTSPVADAATPPVVTAGPTAVPAADVSQPDTPNAAKPVAPKLRNAKISTRLICLPESAVHAVGLTVAEDGSTGVTQLVSRAELQRLITQARAVSGSEVRAFPRLICQTGSSASAEIIREFRYPGGWAPAKSGLLVPTSIETANLGLILTAELTLKGDQAADLHFTADRSRLLGFATADGPLIKPLAPPKGADWPKRLTACEMPAGASGQPKFHAEKGESRLELTTENAAIVFGFRDDESALTKADGRMVDYLALQLEILP